MQEAESSGATGTSTTSTFDTAGYMDVSPFEPGSVQSAEGYMDLSANSTFGDISNHRLGGILALGPVRI